MLYTILESLNVIISLISWPIWIGLRSNAAAVLGTAAYRWISSGQPPDFANWASDAFLDGGVRLISSKAIKVVHKRELTRLNRLR